jgi:protein-S-isoprenylcysteine O-methyltransferase Ste14
VTPANTGSFADSFAERYGRRLSTPVFIVLVLAIVGLVYTRSLLARGPAAIALQAAAILLMIWARIAFGIRSFHYAANPTEGGLVTTGPYRFLRHPIYAAILLFLWAGIATNLSPVSVAPGLVATAMLFLRMVFEESLVRQRYPEYADYARRTKRLVPFLF